MNPATALATVLVDELVRSGLTDAVLAPGSRSAPLAMALHADGRVRLHVRVDERSAAYLALGLGKAGGRAAIVLCTSGTAAANLHPAVVEASQSGVPLLAITADRPPELRETGANQTIDQVKLYGAAVRWFCEVGVPETRAGMVGYWRSLACRAWAASLGPDPGPVHLNLAFREPLVPDGDDTTWPEPLEGRADGAPWTAVVHEPTGVSVAWPAAERGVVVAGDGDYEPRPYVALAEARGWPVLAEPTSNARMDSTAISTYHYLLGVPEFVETHRPETIVTVGKPGLSRPLLGYLGTAREHVVVAGPARWPDPTRSAAAVAPRPVTHPDEPRERSPWLEGWQRAERAARAAIDAVLDAHDEPTEPRLARDLARTLPPGALLFAGSSMPIRDLDRAMCPRTALRILGNRGASGIDGSVSTAIGAAHAHGGPAFALLGDLALLHDQNGLLLGPEEPRPDLTIVVVNNDGGGIFSLLPQVRFEESFERVFGTPHGVDLASVAAAARVPYTRLERMSDLSSALKGEGLRLVEVRTDRRAKAALRAELQRAVTDAVGAANAD
ncbi:MAG: 2-succinyl-5-enolpyruvyl-6-hydroxy-3-cyclohexene-1-carboxylic-acid synthase [Streptosporangiaceae bacterium]